MQVRRISIGHLAAVAWLGVGLLLLTSCSAEVETPEVQIRRTLAALETAAESGDVSGFKELVSEQYTDAQGHDKQALGVYVAFQVMRNGNRHIVLRVRDVLVISPGSAEVTLIAGIGGTRGAGDALSLHGNVYQIDVDLEEEETGTWRLAWAQWKPAAAAELL
ncbi:MAG: hypothetical protein JRH01_03065 [Deltaproteobacteria bacterium]|nr:hypothetical protein [Deltaproteobacteria bacterium]MBW2393200.1 hypothetical protein [Deltaproteobacteria bacterium]